MSVELRLYVSERSSRSRHAIAVMERLRRPLAELGGSCEIIDVTHQPDLAEEDRVLATPTLIRRSPPPPRRIVGDVSDVGLLLARLGLPDDLLEETP